MKLSIDCSILIHKTPSLIPINDCLITAWDNRLKKITDGTPDGDAGYRYKIDYFSVDECSDKSLQTKNNFVTNVNALSKQIEFIPNSLDGITPIKNSPIDDGILIDRLLQHQEAISQQWRPHSRASRSIWCFIDECVCQTSASSRTRERCKLFQERCHADHIILKLFTPKSDTNVYSDLIENLEAVDKSELWLDYSIYDFVLNELEEFFSNQFLINNPDRALGDPDVDDYPPV